MRMKIGTHPAGYIMTTRVPSVGDKINVIEIWAGSNSKPIPVLVDKITELVGEKLYFAARH